VNRYAVLALLALCIVGGGIFFLTSAPQTVAPDARVEQPLPVDVTSVQMVDSYTVTARYAGRVTARRSSNLGFERGGLLATVDVDQGADVKAGDVLAKLDTRTLEAELTQARANEGEATALLGLSDVTVERQRQLLERKNVSAQSYDEARFNREAVVSQLAGTAARIQALEVALELASIRAPYDGQIVARMADEGTVVGPGEPIFKLLENGALEAHIGVPPIAVSALTEGDVYQVDVRGQNYPATLAQVLSEVDIATRTVTAIFAVDAPAGAVRAGELARVDISQTIAQTGFWVPIEALTEGRRGLWALFAVVPPERATGDAPAADNLGMLERRTVQLLHTDASKAFVRGTLEPGDVYVVRGTHRLVPGQEVIVQQIKQQEPGGPQELSSTAAPGLRR